MTSLLRHCHLQHVCSCPSPLLHSTCFIQCWSLCDLHVAPHTFAQLFNYLFIYYNLFAISLWCCLQSNFHLWSLQTLSLIVQWKAIWGSKVGGWPLARTEESGRRNPNNPYIQVML
jgi:hypothetical protein